MEKPRGGMMVNVSPREVPRPNTINDLQYRGGKMATMSEMSLKMGLNFDFERNTSTNTAYQEKLHHK